MKNLAFSFEILINSYQGNNNFCNGTSNCIYQISDQKNGYTDTLIFWTKENPLLYYQLYFPYSKGNILCQPRLLTPANIVLPIWLKANGQSTNYGKGSL